jgi:hypothetical protein
LSEQKFLEIQRVEHPDSNGLAQRYAREEEIREGKSREEERREDKDMSSKLDFVVQIFEHWKIVWNHPRAALDMKRTVVIRRALKGYSPQDLCTSISGYKNSPHHTGQNDRQTVYDDIGLLLRDSAHIDAGIRFAEQPQALTSELANHNVAVLKDWQPLETRDASTGHGEISGDNGESGGGFRKAALPGPR